MTGMPDPLIDAAALALARGDPLGALKRVGWREDAAALALRGMALAQMGELGRARELLRAAARGFGPREALARARCALAEAEIALVLRDLEVPTRTLSPAWAVLAARGDRTNAAHARYLEARRLLLVGRLAAAAAVLEGIDGQVLPPASRCGAALVAAGIALRRVRAAEAEAAITAARAEAARSGIAALAAEVERTAAALAAPVARLSGRGQVRLAQVEALFASDALVVDACRLAVRRGAAVVPLAGRPVLMALARALGEAWPGDADRASLIARAFRGREADESHRARLRVEIGRLRRALDPLARAEATRGGFALQPGGGPVAVLLPPIETAHGWLLALLADGEAWSSSGLALAAGVSPRTVQRALEALAAENRVEAVGRGRARRWMAPRVPGFPTALLLPVADAGW